MLSIDPWNVGGVSLIVDERTSIKGDITLGEMVKVKGWIMEDGSWLATEIKHTGLHLGQGCFMVSSVVQIVNDEEIILIDGQTLVRSEDLEVQGDLKEGSLVRYQYCVDKDGVGTIGRIIVVYQLEELPHGRLLARLSFAITRPVTRETGIPSRLARRRFRRTWRMAIPRGLVPAKNPTRSQTRNPRMVHCSAGQLWDVIDDHRYR